MRWGWMLETLQGFPYVLLHVEMCLTFVIIPCQVDSAVLGTFPVDFHLVVFTEDAQQMERAFLPDVFHAKIIYHEGKAHWSPLVGPEAGRVLALCVAVHAQTFLKQLLGNYARVFRPYIPLEIST